MTISQEQDTAKHAEKMAMLRRVRTVLVCGQCQRDGGMAMRTKKSCQNGAGLRS